MKPFLKAALFGTALATAVFFFHFLMPLLALLLFFGLIRLAVFGRRWRHAAYAGYGRHWAQRTPTVDGRDWQRPGNTNTQARDVRVD